MILSNTSLSTQGSEKLPEIAKVLAPFVQETLRWFRHQYEVELKVATFLVAIGVILEGFELVHELKKKPNSPPTPKWITNLAFAGWIMVSVGVAGEFIFEGWVGTKNEELESISNALLADAQLSSAEAAERAGDAATNAQRAQENEAAIQRVEKDFLLGRASGRFLKNDLSALLKNLPVARARVEYKPRDDEALEFANVIQLSLVDAGWEVPTPNKFLDTQKFPHGEIPPGVTIFNRDAEVLNPFWLMEPTATGEDFLDTTLLPAQLHEAGLKGADIQIAIALITGLEAVLEKDKTLSEEYFDFDIVVGPMRQLKPNK